MTKVNPTIKVPTLADHSASTPVPTTNNFVEYKAIASNPLIPPAIPTITTNKIIQIYFLVNKSPHECSTCSSFISDSNFIYTIGFLVQKTASLKLSILL